MIPHRSLHIILTSQHQCTALSSRTPLGNRESLSHQHRTVFHQVIVTVTSWSSLPPPSSWHYPDLPTPGSLSLASSWVLARLVMPQFLEEPDSVVPDRQEVQDRVKAAAHAHQRPPHLVGHAAHRQQLAVLGSQEAECDVEGARDVEGHKAEGEEAAHQQDGPDGLGPGGVPRPLEGLLRRGQAPDHQRVAHQDDQGGHDKAGQRQNHTVGKKPIEVLRTGHVVADHLAADVGRVGEAQCGQQLEDHQGPGGSYTQQGVPAGPVRQRPQGVAHAQEAVHGDAGQ
ncbi:uncharacterized protein LOC118677449 [Myotis myotis]|uniref:uncharacterized protein LOC118677449 n=1 Tax=Myotis myotis TaxID=51298 RepID=UPI00174BAD97|nr:uncharacterized protein LOC118677449 [Myotis myotis]